MTLDVQDFEEKFIEALSSEIDYVSIEQFPDIVGNYRVNHENGAILIRWEGASEARRLNSTLYILRHRFLLTLLVRNLHTENGIYNLFSDLREFFNKTIVDSYPLIFEAANRINYYDDDMLWHYEINFSVDSYEND